MISRRQKTAHTDLVRVCIDWLTLSHIPAWQNNTGASQVEKRFIRFGFPGSSDILGCLPPHGRFLAVEAKVKPDKPTPAQRSFLAMVNNAGGLGLVVYTLEELIATLENERNKE